MEVIFPFVVGFIVLIIAIYSVIKIITNRVTTPTNELKEEIINLKERMNELENDKK